MPPAHLNGPAETAQCEAAAREALRGRRGLLLRVDPSYLREMRALERAVAMAARSSFELEGHVAKYPWKLSALASAASVALARARAAGLGGITVCEVGFNMGHSALNFLLADPAVSVLSFDLGEHPLPPHPGNQ